MKILVLGASSYVGARLYLDLSKNHEVIGTFSNNKLCADFIQLDITNASAVSAVIKSVKPDLIIHVANNADARWCEANPTQAHELNEKSTVTIANEAKKHSARLLYISSFAAINPENVYGETKRSSEEIIKSTCEDWLIIRPSLIVGFSPNTTNDRPFNRFLKNIDAKTQAEYDNSWQFQPTFLGHISEIIEQSLQKELTKLVLPVAVNELVTRYQLATDILTPFGITVSPTKSPNPPAIFKENLSILRKYELSEHSYKDSVESVAQEIRNREHFTL